MWTKLIQVGIALAMVAGVFFTGYKTGHSEAMYKCLEEKRTQNEKHIETLKATQTQYSKQLVEESKKAKATIEKLKNRPPKVVYVKDETVKAINEESGCTNLGNEFKRVFSDIHKFSTTD